MWLTNTWGAICLYGKSGTNRWWGFLGSDGFDGLGRICCIWARANWDLGIRTPSEAIVCGPGLSLLAKSRHVETNFIIREAFYGAFYSRAVPGDFGNRALLQRLRQEFVHNLVESDYILCVRGNGNFSYRLYETLSCGRIPVFINTDCVLPYDFAVDWKEYCVWVELQELPHIGEKVAEFHARLSPADFKELQCRCRDFWQHWLSPEGFFANFHRHLDI